MQQSNCQIDVEKRGGTRMREEGQTCNEHQELTMQGRSQKKGGGGQRNDMRECCSSTFWEWQQVGSAQPLEEDG